ncbi:MAG: LPS assembly lipoprotein LptE [Endomicrobium sp.]|nr:LPS assembly lipoprotein LptE [Endomicrobium sp.]
MRKLIVSSFLSVLFSITLISCASLYDPAVQILPEHVKKVYVRPFINNTKQFGLEAKFMNAVIGELLSDGRLSLVNTEGQSDAVLTVTIKRYILQPLIYDINGITEQYKLWVIVGVSFIDKYNNTILWTESNMEGVHIYRDKRQSNDEIDDAMNEDEAREIVWEKLSRNIVKRIIKGFGSVTSISEKCRVK